VADRQRLREPLNTPPTPSREGVVRHHEGVQAAAFAAEQRTEAGVGGLGDGAGVVVQVGLQALQRRPRHPEPLLRRARATQPPVGPRLLERLGVDCVREVDRRVARVPHQILLPRAVEEVEVTPHRRGEVLEHGKQRPLREIGGNVRDAQCGRSVGQQTQAGLLCVLLLVDVQPPVRQLGHRLPAPGPDGKLRAVAAVEASRTALGTACGPAPPRGTREDGGAGVVAGVVTARVRLRATLRGALGGVAAVLASVGSAPWLTGQAQLLVRVRKAAALAVPAFAPEPKHLRLDEHVRRSELIRAVGELAGRIRAVALSGEGLTHAGVLRLWRVAQLLGVVGVCAPAPLITAAMLIEFAHVSLS